MTLKSLPAWVLLIALAARGPACAGEAIQHLIEGKIVGISDGDTVILLTHAKTSHKIRLEGIDAPEKRQAFGTRSAQNLSKLVFNKAAVAECGKRDRYGRDPAFTSIPNDIPF